ncbi:MULTISPECIES: cryptochrome/photolyase family protein [Rhizobium/Agrobacterium group]|uniref:Deoxyribodipyrimidine photo-lyase n=2 Tax=Rhizobium/Agrobacterium group TaxID=227290 RepID=B9JVR8_ALLAM|nr:MULTISPECIES: deoxyribodipyrimidine photo-lyase [Rhizobium/Agrobacterium group]ACM36348.1 DNA photolyase [Allorhizobium ampelinum S4]MCF1449790.1 deoxyribodipyrimidine photo-lyase [Allorhizobium ampelinum]MCF1494764.1 deoxyribodipyrimidine photo-lyase [Allorhizobium ampelinum]MUO27771.1 deoxyribodipyrimidine photo-lyase [Agrobacterium vitis]MUO44169.1 deoxyribodipyrimidine photo-lyase [Agrobacterium vitis]
MPNAHPSPTILWFRKDLRLDDNRALLAALQAAGPVIPLYIREPEEMGTGPLGPAQAWWLHHSLVSLDQSLQSYGSRLVLRRGPPGQVLRHLIEETGSKAVHWNRRYDPSGMAIDAELKAALRSDGLEATSHAGFLLHEPSKVKTGSGGPFRVYTPFWRALEKQGDPPPPVERPKTLHNPAHWPDSDRLEDWQLLPTKPDWAKEFSEIWTPGEPGAQDKLSQFIDHGLKGYRTQRDFPALPHTSGLSPHLALGEISPARIWHATIGLGDDVSTDDYVHFRKELVWREFSYHLLFHFADLASQNWNDRFNDFPWKKNAEFLSAWQRGQTGYPIVDAGMRQLWRHGVMHNRVRMIVASFLIKDLMIDWREGEAWFRYTLVDADPASNAASWQWVAGSGADASPFFRIFNPITQSEKFDPDGDYIRQFVPELAKLPNNLIHRPFEAPAPLLEKAGITLGKTYPAPLVDHKRARAVALEAYKSTGSPD